ncbi:ABC transporter ATP-binding protein [Porphyromonas sp.]|uniref:ABC transporter ATP-binding protein n=1 Tax=Porphyromonas sp. TaxID=1924944 RepID=UPI0026DA72A6|nr:ATP-binding cassette domain-containing protein [Porphyromonas sp.]MDO4695637.1 ATP-binding cassette domain-containing protein [Porphyromonas sp.]MDO4771533.1 ATP-binding cassette domain-containing protein [Porphyromonas sp.]
MIEVKSVEKKFDTKEVLRGISATFKEGECSLVIGKSGAGKTVLLKTIVGLMPPDKGEVMYDNTSLYDLGSEDLKALRQQVGMLFQGSALFDSMTIFENIMFPLDMFSNYKPGQRVQIAKDCIERVKLYDARYKYPAEVSGGMMKRAAIARAIALEPKYLFCDEPNSGLDPETSRHIDELISTITKESNITTVINTHDMKSVTNIGDHVIFVNKGKISWEGKGADIHRSDNEKLKHFVFVSEL